jgi:stringent starvation protein B
MSEAPVPSTRPYLIRALYEWCMDSGFTPYLAVQADEAVQVPREFVKNGEIVLNISPDATSGLHISNEWVEFKARFNGVARDIWVPIDHVLAIYARENGQGMAFPAPATKSGASTDQPDPAAKAEPSTEPPPNSPRPTLTRIK